MDMYMRLFCSELEQPNLAYADVKLKIVYMHALACLHSLSLCVYCKLYDFHPLNSDVLEHLFKQVRVLFNTHHLKTVGSVEHRTPSLKSKKLSRHH